MNNFSYSEYQTIIEHIRSNIPIVKFDNVDITTDKYCVIRHDVEFSVERALNLARIESMLNIPSTYVFQVCNNNYNPFSHKNRKQILEIVKLGHDIGIHVHLGNFDKSYEIGRAHV